MASTGCVICDDRIRLAREFSDRKANFVASISCGPDLLEWKPCEHADDGLVQIDGRVACNTCATFMDDGVIGYKLTIEASDSWIFCGTTPGEVARVLEEHLESDSGERWCCDRDTVTVTPYLTTRRAIEEMPEFEGW